VYYCKRSFAKHTEGEESVPTYFARFETPGNKTVYVNPDCVRQFQLGSDGTVILLFDDKEALKVTGTPEDIERQLTGRS
jgi:hypothetical protein